MNEPTNPTPPEPKVQVTAQDRALVIKLSKAVFLRGIDATAEDHTQMVANYVAAAVEAARAEWRAQDEKTGLLFSQRELPKVIAQRDHLQAELSRVREEFKRVEQNCDSMNVKLVRAIDALTAEQQARAEVQDLKSAARNHASATSGMCQQLTARAERAESSLAALQADNAQLVACLKAAPEPVCADVPMNHQPYENPKVVENFAAIDKWWVFQRGRALSAHHASSTEAGKA